MQEQAKTKSNHAEREEKILAYWKEKGIFEKSLAKNKEGGKAFIFYEGPPTANGHPGIHHLEARAFKDAIPRYKTMQGYYVRRKGGWDTHGLPVELQVEKELGLKSKKDIEAYGIGAFNEKCKESVWKYVHEWEDFTRRMAYWVDLKNPYITYKPYYIESVWNIVKNVAEQKLLYKDYKVVPWCPRCGTALSSHELAQGYETVKDMSVYVKFKIKGKNSKRFFLAWTTTPWTLPGNVALAVGEKIKYVEVVLGASGEHLIFAKERLSVIKEEYKIVHEVTGEDLIGLQYEPLYPFINESVTGEEKAKLKNAYKVYAADFVTTTDGTGIVHTAVMYGPDDFELGTRVGLPKYHLVGDDGTFRKEAGFLAGKFVKDEETEVAIIKDLAHREPEPLLYAKEKYEHTYPFCWRCHTPLIYFARDSWYIRMSSLRNELIKGNEGIHWEPEHIKEGRFGEWLKEVKDWAISRERYWGTPLPIWVCEKCQKGQVIGSIAEIAKKARNNFWVMRHGEAENNVKGVLNYADLDLYHLTEKGKSQVEASVKELKKLKIDTIYVSPLLRTRETAAVVAKELGMKEDKIIVMKELREFNMGNLDGRAIGELTSSFPDEVRFEKWPEGGESYPQLKKRMGDALYTIESQNEGKNILIVTHETPGYLLLAAARYLDRNETLAMRPSHGIIGNAEIKKVDFEILPHNAEYELDLHKPFIDEVRLACSCGGEMRRVKEVMDVWFDSGSMPFAEDHYPFVNEKYIDKEGYPADYISEAIDQTRGWFYTLHAIGTLMGKGKAYRNVVCLGHLLDAEGKKMSKSLGNIVDPFKMMDKYGADTVRLWMYSVNQAGDSKNFDEKTVDEVLKKNINLILNVLAFYKMYEDKDLINSAKAGGRGGGGPLTSRSVLDRWIINRENLLVLNVTKNLDQYHFFEAARAIRDFVGDLSQWYLRRSRDRFKSDDEKDKRSAFLTMRHVLITLAKVIAPFAPFLAEHVYLELGGEGESVHLASWPQADDVDYKLLEHMDKVRMYSSLGLEARMKAKINVRQPLSKLTVNGEKDLSEDLIGLIRDEVNVKDVVFDPQSLSITLDTNITPALEEEGLVRELLREVQDWRKQKGLLPGQKVSIRIITNASGEELLSRNKETVMKNASLQNIEVENGPVPEGEKYVFSLS